MSRPARRCSRHFALAALAAAACAPRVAYRAEAADTRALCGVDSEDEGALRAAAATLPSRECADAIFDDYNVDVDAFLAADGLDDPYFLVGVTADTLPRAQRRSRLALVLLNARGLLMTDYGRLGAVEPGALLAPGLADELHAVAEVTGEDEVGLLLYDLTAGVIERVAPGHREGARAAFGSERRTLWVTLGTGDPWVIGSLFVHEARHLWDSHGPCPWDDQKSCDTDIDGAYGWGLSAKHLAWRHAEDPELRRMLEGDVRMLLHHIITHNDAEGALLPRYQQLDLDAQP
ncbi:MAG: hypothetical protein RL071_3340 [Pseudomonadota bacterium]